MEKIKLGIIGLGMAWEKLHFPALQRLSDKFEIRAVCDNDIRTARAEAQKLGLPPENAFDCHESFLDTSSDLGIEACAVMVPIENNYDVAKAVISHRKHLIAEKPFAATIEGAKELCDLADSKNVKVLVAENWRYDEALRIIKDIICSGRIGNAVYFIDNYVTEFTREMLGDSFPSREWRQHPDFAGGIFLDSGVHHIAKMRYLFGEVRSVYATGRPGESDFCPYSCINALLTFDNCVTGHYSYSNIMRETQAPLVGMRIFGTSGEIYLEEKDCGYVNLSFKDGGREVIPYRPDQGYYNEYINFYDAFAEGLEIEADPEKETGDISVVFDILKSIDLGEAVIRGSADISAVMRRSARHARNGINERNAINGRNGRKRTEGLFSAF